jgi:hypothetical protein
MMFRWTIVFLLALAGRAAAAPAMWVVGAKSSVELDALARGRLRLWLGTHVEICRIDARSSALKGELKVQIDVAPKRATKVSVISAGRMPKAVAACLARNLREVSFGELAPRLVWDGTLRLDPDGPSIEATVQSLYGKLDDFVVQSVVLAALDQPAECMTRFFTAQPVVSAVLVATFDADGAHVAESTADPGGAVACVASLLAPVAWPDELLRGAKLRIALLRPTTAVDGDAIILAPAGSGERR